jgi:uncharacterized phage-associated protein
MPLKFRPKLDKIVELLLYLAHVRPGVDKYQAVKFFYLADREHLVRYGRPITFESYFALSYGPVASNALDLLNGKAGVMAAAGLRDLPFVIETGKASNGTDTVFIKKPLRAVKQELFSKSDLKVFDEIIRKYGHMNFEQLSELTHDHRAYKKAWSARRLFSKRSEMDYADMIEDLIDDPKKRAAMIEDLSPIAAHMQ